MGRGSQKAVQSRGASEMVGWEGEWGVCHGVPNVTLQLRLCMVGIVTPVYLGWIYPILRLRKVQSRFSVAHDGQHLNTCMS